MNRPPSKTDAWWKKHEEECGGRWTKVAEPEPSSSQLKAMSAKERAGRQKSKIDGWIKGGSGDGKGGLGPANDSTTSNAVASEGAEPIGLKRQRSAEGDGSTQERKQAFVACPICEAPVKVEGINEHLDEVHSLGS